jgi:hypothetical protein
MNRCCSPNIGRRDADKPVFPACALKLSRLLRFLLVGTKAVRA